MIGMPDPSADETLGLLQQVADGDEAAFGELYRLLAPSAYGLALRITGDQHLAQDVLQETFAQVWSQASRFDPRVGSARAWVTVLAHRRAVDRVRREQSDTRRFSDWAAASQEPAVDHVADVVELRSEQRTVRQALRDLSPRQREALELVYFQGLTHSQVAAHLDIPAGTAKTRIRDGLLALRRHLEDRQ